VSGCAGCNHCTMKLFLPCNTRNLLRDKVTDLPLDTRLRNLDVARRGSVVWFHEQLPCPAPMNSYERRTCNAFTVSTHTGRSTRQWTTRSYLARFRSGCEWWLGLGTLPFHSTYIAPLRWAQHLRTKHAISQRPLGSNPSGLLSLKCVTL
jgi:hypothetical protein